jgi:Fur family ferric uptake transcriptional regulator
MLTRRCCHASIANENRFHLEIEMTLTQNKIASILRQQGYKITPQRRAVLNTIALSHDHLTPAAIYKKVHEEHPGIGLVTVYRTLDILTELGLICEVHAEGNCRSYLMRRPSEHHHHLICSDCGTVTDFTDCDLSNLEQRLARETRFEIKGHLLEFTGRCHNCRKGMNSGGK